MHVNPSGTSERAEVWDALARMASATTASESVANLADAWRRATDADAAVVWTRDDETGWTIAATRPGGVSAATEAGDVLAEILVDATVRSVDAHGASLGVSGPRGMRDGPGLGVRLSAGGREFLLVGLGLHDAPSRATMSAARAVAAMGHAVLGRGASRALADIERSKADKLVSAGMALSSELDLDEVLQRVVDTACDVLGARYAALGVLDSRRTGLANFVTSGLGDAERRAIGDLPRGRGLLGLLITDARPVRIASIVDDPRSAGFPSGHPPMTTFLGVPIRVGAKVFGNLYVTDRLEGSFSDEDELVALTLAAQAAVAIGNAQRYSEQEQTALQAAQDRERATADGWKRAIEAQEAERARIARELHDEAGQELTALTLHLRAMDDHVSDEAGRAGLAEVRRALARTSANLRALAIELRPSGLREHGLASAIERQAERLQESSGVAIDVAVAAIPGGLVDAFEIALFRVVQEALTNVVRHSGAKRASVVASLRDGRLRVVIEDDGKGFDPSVPTDRLGLAGIRERIQLLGGGLRIESARRAGTTVIVELEVANG